MSQVLPDGWMRVRLGDILLNIEAGKSFTCEPRRAEADEWGVIKVSAMTWGKFDEDENKAMPASRKPDPRYEIRPGDILVSRANTEAYVGAPVLVGQCRPRLLLSDKSLRLVPSDEVDRRWLVYVLASPTVRSQISAKSTGAQESMRNISQSTLADIEIYLPPRAEQHRIVEALEGHLSRLDVGSQTISANGLRLARLRMRLMSTLTSEPHSSMTPTTIGSVSHRVRNGLSVSRPGVFPSGVPILRIGAVRAMALDLTDLRYTGIDPGSESVSQALLNEGDLLFTRYNGNPEYVGACAVVPSGVGPLTYPDKLIRVEVDQTRAIPRYVALVCSGGRSRDHIRRSVKTTAGQAGISGHDLKMVPIHLPDIAEQKRRLDQFDEANRILLRLSNSLSFASQRAEHLRRSLLADAFSGHLVPQGPDDEPAVEVLRRIERARGNRPATIRSQKAVARSVAPPSRSTDVISVGIQEELPL